MQFLFKWKKNWNTDIVSNESGSDCVIRAKTKVQKRGIKIGGEATIVQLSGNGRALFWLELIILNWSRTFWRLCFTALLSAHACLLYYRQSKNTTFYPIFFVIDCLRPASASRYASVIGRVARSSDKMQNNPEKCHWILTKWNSTSRWNIPFQNRKK